MVATLRQLMTSHAGVIRSGEGLAHALDEIARLENEAGPGSLFVNAATAARLIAAAAFARVESRGGHIRSDFPEPREAWRHRTFLTLQDAERIADMAISAHSGSVHERQIS